MSSPIYLSIIIPTYQRDDLLAKCLAPLQPARQQELNDRYEVIVTDDGTKINAREMIARSYPWVQWVEGPHRGPAANRNNGARQAVGDWLLFIDDDCLPDQNWLTSMAKAAHSENFDVIEGKTIAPDRQDDPSKYYVENLAGGLFWSCNLAMRRDLFLKLGGFDEDFLEAGGEDMELAFRIRSWQLRTTFLEQAMVLHPSRDVTFKYLLWRTLMLRWTILYKLKTNQCVPLSAPPVVFLPRLAVELFVHLLRTTWHLIGKHDKRRWRQQLFDQVWQLLAFPFTLPYLLIWDWRFRKRLTENNPQSVRH